MARGGGAGERGAGRWRRGGERNRGRGAGVAGAAPVVVGVDSLLFSLQPLRRPSLFPSFLFVGVSRNLCSVCGGEERRWRASCGYVEE